MLETGSSENVIHKVRGILDTLALPGCAQNMTASQQLESLYVKDGSCVIVIALHPEQAFLRQDVERAVSDALSHALFTIPFHIVLTQKVEPPSSRPALRPPSQKPKRLKGVKFIIAVGSGKGGVGKSTTALNLAYSLHVSGWRVGILDADIYGPSIHKMLKTSQTIQSDGQHMIPAVVHGIKVMSIGFLVSAHKSVIWRGPMVHHALRQMLFEVSWGELDCLVIDLPPGTGDVPLSLAQNVALDGVVIVSTPQEIALIDVRKAIDMFRTMGVPLLGCVENMSVFHCPHCHHQIPVFLSQGVFQEAERQKISFLGAVPLDPVIMQSGEEGSPVLYAQPGQEVSRIYRDIGLKVRHQLNVLCTP